MRYPEKKRKKNNLKNEMLRNFIRNLKIIPVCGDGYLEYSTMLVIKETV